MRGTRKTCKKPTKKYRKKLTKKYYGGEWVSKNNINDEQCGICQRSFRETPGLAIYKTDCGHLFHNDCLYNKCIANRNNWYCPICNTRITEDQCTDVWAFKNKAMDERDIRNNEIRNIYINQHVNNQE